MTKAERRERNRAAWKAFCERREAKRISDRDRLKRERSEDADGAIRFTCAHCGRRFQLRHPVASDLATAPDYRGKSYVRLGGKIWCQACAAKRFRRQPNPEALVHPDSIQ